MGGTMRGKRIDDVLHLYVAWKQSTILRSGDIINASDVMLSIDLTWHLRKLYKNPKSPCYTKFRESGGCNVPSDFNFQRWENGKWETYFTCSNASKYEPLRKLMGPKYFGGGEDLDLQDGDRILYEDW